MVFPSWTPGDLRALTSRERAYWAQWARAKWDNDSSARNRTSNVGPPAAPSGGYKRVVRDAFS